MKKKDQRKNVLPPIRVSDKELADALLKAEVYCKGNLSKWVRRCLRNYGSKKKEE